MNIDVLYESIIDPTRKGLDPRVFDRHGDEYSMKTYLRSQLLDIVNKIDSSIVNVNNWYVKGSILSRQWLEWSDIDIVLEIDQDISDDEWDQIRQDIDDVYEGIVLSNTKHEIEIFPNRGEYNQDRTEGLYDVVSDEWIKGPYDMSVDLKKYAGEFNKNVRSFDLALGELERDLTDYLVYQSLDQDELSGLSDQVKSKIADIDRDVDAIIKKRDDIKLKRREAFGDDPEEIMRYGSRQKLPANVIQKMLERYKYISLSKALKKIRKSEGNQDVVDSEQEIEKMKELFDLPSKFREL